jgi:aerobic-type carbon monoxide dehydrogenase small subunit (CoxS/CutS family)
MSIEITVDGETHSADPDPRVVLAQWLRSVGKTGVHVGATPRRAARAPSWLMEWP